MKRGTGRGGDEEGVEAVGEDKEKSGSRFFLKFVETQP